MNRLVFQIVVPGLAVAWLPLAWAVGQDTVELSGGGHLTGQVQRLDEQKLVIVTVDEDLRVALPASRVRRVVESDRLAPYRRAAAAAGNDAEQHYELAIDCAKAQNFPGDSEQYKRYHLQRAIELDPNHSKARAALDYIKDNGQWVRLDDLMRRRGMIREGLGWQLPEVVAVDQANEAADKAAKQWSKDVARLTGLLTRPARGSNGSAKQAEAKQALEAITDPLAAVAVAKQLSDSRGNGSQNQQLRLLWVKLLGSFRNGPAVRELVKTGIDEPDQIVREAALEQLQQYGAGSAVATYLPMLKSNDNALVNRAAQALSWFPDPELALTYVDALVTEHKHKVLPGAGTQAGFSQDGSGAFSTGGKAKEITIPKQNPAVLGLLNTIEEDANFGYDETRWREHFATMLTAYDGDLRRDP